MCWVWNSIPVDNCSGIGVLVAVHLDGDRDKGISAVVASACECALEMVNRYCRRAMDTLIE